MSAGLPLLPCATYAVFRALLDDTLCWALPAESDGWIEWIYMIPGKEVASLSDGLRSLRASAVCGDRLWPRSLGCINSFFQNIGPHESDDIFISNTGDEDRKTYNFSFHWARWCF